MSTRNQRLDALNDWFRTHHGVIVTERLHEIGFSASAISRLAGSGQLVRICASAYRSPAHHLGPRQQMAAICALNPSAAVGLLTAGQHFGLRGMLTNEVYVLVPHGSTPTWPGVTVHRCRKIADVDVTDDDIDGIRYTSPPRTVFDCADLLGPRRTESVVEQLLRDERCTLDTLTSTAARLYHPSRPGSRTMRAVLESRPSWRNSARSELERMVREAVEARGLPAPEVNQRIELPDGQIIEVDLWWDRWDVAGEVDHPFWHDGEHERHRDRKRDRKLLTVGVQTVRFDTIDADGGLDEALDDLTAILLRRGWRSAAA